MQNDHSNTLGFEFCPSTFLSQKYVSDWKPEMRLPNDSEHVVLNGLDWNTEYEVHVVAENQQGRSEPGIRSIRTASEPTTIPGTIPIHPPRASTHTHTSHRAQKASTRDQKRRYYLDHWLLQGLYAKLAAVGSGMNHLSPSVT